MKVKNDGHANTGSNSEREIGRRERERERERERDEINSSLMFPLPTILSASVFIEESFFSLSCLRLNNFDI